MARSRLTLILSVQALLSSICSAYLGHQLQDDPLHLARHLTLYSYFAGALSVFGILGAKNNNPTLVKIFANYLFIDIIICSVARLLIMTLLPELADSVCSANSVRAWLEQAQTSGSSSFGLPVTDSWEENLLVTSQMQEQCRRAVGVLQVLAVLVTIGGAAIQVFLALRVNAYARTLQSMEWAGFDEMPVADQVAEKQMTGLLDEKIKLQGKLCSV